jgi:phytoene dehydrogenase-like protein
MANAYDVLVIGADLDGLVAAAYLARAGKKVLVLDRHDTLGGPALSEEGLPGFCFNTVQHDAGWLNPKIVKDLDLVRHGLKLLQSEVTVFEPGSGLTLWRDATKSAQALARFSKADAEKWPAFNAQMIKLAGFLQRIYTQTPPSITTTNPVEVWSLLRLGGQLRGLGRRDMMEMVRALPLSVHELLNDWFETDTLKGAIGASGITNLMQGPRASGTVLMLLHHLTGSGAFRAIRTAHGGIGSIAQAIAAAAKQHGAEIRLNSEVIQLVVKADRAVGVALANGEEIKARSIVSAADARRTFLEWIGPAYLETDFMRAVQNIKYRGIRAKVNLALSELPQFGGADESMLRGVISISPSLDYLERAYDDAKYGRVSGQPYLEATIPSLNDSTLAPAGQHVMSIWMQYAPYRLRESQWDDAQREALGDRVVNALSGYAPNLKRAILHRQVLTPLDLETRCDAPEGNVYQGDLTLDQFLFMRPVAGWAQYHTPIAGLWLCGAAAHPGGGLAGAAGYNAAREIVKHIKS